MTGLPIDIANPEDIEAKLPDVRRERDRAKAEMAKAIEVVDSWDSLIDGLEARLRLAGIEPPPPSTGEGRDASSQERAVQIVTQEGEPMSVGEVAAVLPDVKRKTVGWALWRAAQDDELVALGNGVYAPPDHVSDQDELLASRNGATPAAEEATEE